MVICISRTEQEILSGENYNMSYIRKMVKVSFHYVHIYCTFSNLIRTLFTVSEG